MTDSEEEDPEDTNDLGVELKDEGSIYNHGRWVLFLEMTILVAVAGVIWIPPIFAASDDTGCKA